MSRNTSQQTSWSQEVPLQMPWSTPIDPNVMTFTAQHHQLFPTVTPLQPNASNSGLQQPVMPGPCEVPTIWKFPSQNNPTLKRRNSSSDEDDDDEGPPSKVHAGADKVAAKLSYLDIDSDHERLIIEELSDDARDDLDDDDTLESNQPVIHLSDEVRCAFSSQIDAVNTVLQEELDKNKKALVLWRPPRSLVQITHDDDDYDFSTGIKIEEILDDNDQMETS